MSASPHRGLSTQILGATAAHAVDLASTFAVADLPTLVAPKESELFFTGPFFLVFFPVSIIGGLPFLAWLRLKSLGGPDSP